MRLFKTNAITAVGLVIVALALWNASTVVRFLINGTHTKGTVVEMAQTQDGLWHPVIEFVANDGKTHKVEPGSASVAPDYRKGQSVDVVYMPDDLQNWSLTGFSDLWLGTTIAIVLGWHTRCDRLWLSIHGERFVESQWGKNTSISRRGRHRGIGIADDLGRMVYEPRCR